MVIGQGAADIDVQASQAMAACLDSHLGLEFLWRAFAAQIDDATWCNLAI